MSNPTYSLELRDVLDSDLPIFFEYEQDPDANYMAAFTSPDPSDRAAFDAHWARIRANDAIILRTIVVDGEVAGNMTSFMMEGEREIGYWLGREFWGKGIATRALAAFLEVVTERPLYARVAKDNGASIRVLEKCGFRIIAEERGYANARGEEIAEVVMMLAG